MSAKVKLREIVDALDMQNDEHTAYVDLDNGEVYVVSNELLDEADSFDGVSPPEILEWQQGEWEAALRIATSGRCKGLPTKFDIHEWEFLRDFTLSVKDRRIREELENCIHGPGAFRRFKNAVWRHEMQDQWHAFRDRAIAQIARDWCEVNGIEYDETPTADSGDKTD